MSQSCEPCGHMKSLFHSGTKSSTELPMLDMIPSLFYLNTAILQSSTCYFHGGFLNSNKRKKLHEWRIN